MSDTYLWKDERPGLPRHKLATTSLERILQSRLIDARKEIAECWQALEEIKKQPQCGVECKSCQNILATVRKVTEGVVSKPAPADDDKPDNREFYT